MSGKVRLDVLLVERGLAESRERAQRLVRAGLVYTENERLEKPGRLVPADLALIVKGDDCPYVSRGGLKLAGALDAFGHNPEGEVALDIGASTGGFTDCLLQRGAKLVHAVDVGRAQLHEKLRRDVRVVSREKTHFETLAPEDFAPPPDVAAADLSFISLRRLFPVLYRLMDRGKRAIVLAKPQFEVGRERLPRGGVVHDEALQREVVELLCHAASHEGFAVTATCESPIAGQDGNREFFLYLLRQ